MVDVLVVVGSVKGSPGVSCLTAGMACYVGCGAAAGARRLGGRVASPTSSLTGSSVLVVEADPAGGVFAGRAGLEPQRGMASLAAATRGRALSVETVAPHVQSLAGNAGVLVGPLAGEQATSALDVLADELASFGRARPDSELVLVDAGRVDMDSVATPLVWGSDGVLLVVWAHREGLEQAAAWLAASRGLRGRVGVVVREPVGEMEYSPREVSDGLGVSVLGRLPEDAGTNVAFGDARARRNGLRGGWWRGVGQIAEQVRRLAPLTPNDPVVASTRGVGSEWAAGPVMAAPVMAGPAAEWPGGGEQL